LSRNFQRGAFPVTPVISPERVDVPECYCPKCGRVQAKPPEMEEPPVVNVSACVCPTCLLPLRFTAGPWLREVDLDSLPLAERNQFERVIDRIREARMQAAKRQGILV